MKRNEDRPTITPEEAGKMLGMSGNYLRQLLREGRMQEVGFAVQNSLGQWRYYVYKAKVKAITEVVSDRKRLFEKEQEEEKGNSNELVVYGIRVRRDDDGEVMRGGRVASAV